MHIHGNLDKSWHSVATLATISRGTWEWAFVLAYLWASHVCGKQGHAAGRGCCRTQPSRYSSREANSFACPPDCLTKHIPKLWSAFLLPSSLSLAFTFPLLRILNKDCLGFAGRPVMRLGVYLLGWDQICDTAVGWDLTMFFWVSDKFQKRYQGLDLWGNEESKNACHH